MLKKTKLRRRIMIMIMSRQNNITSTRKNNDNYNNTILDNNNNDNVNKKTKVLYGTQSSTKALVEFVSRAKQKIDSVIDSKAPSVIIEVESIKKERFAAAKDRGVEFRYVTEITKDNLTYCKEMLKFAEIRHLDGVKGNFEVSDIKEY
ncbi:MAG TPA: hypothetical protein VKA95_02820, partial [Nitrososphaeraceae archaeon]|nr:hypothetical protein [Nitrososphaeraceae archaeon]